MRPLREASFRASASGRHRPMRSHTLNMAIRTSAYLEKDRSIERERGERKSTRDELHPALPFKILRHYRMIILHGSKPSPRSKAVRPGVLRQEPREDRQGQRIDQEHVDRIVNVLQKQLPGAETLWTLGILSLRRRITRMRNPRKQKPVNSRTHV